MSDIFIFICGATISMLFFVIGVLFGAALKSQDRSIILTLPDDFELEDAAAEEQAPEGDETA